MKDTQEYYTDCQLAMCQDSSLLKVSSGTRKQKRIFSSDVETVFYWQIADNKSSPVNPRDVTQESSSLGAWM